MYSLYGEVLLTTSIAQSFKLPHGDSSITRIKHSQLSDWSSWEILYSLNTIGITSVGQLSPGRPEDSGCVIHSI